MAYDLFLRSSIPTNYARSNSPVGSSPKRSQLASILASRQSPSASREPELERKKARFSKDIQAILAKYL